MNIEIYTDGSCKNNPGRGGYAFVITRGKKELLRMYGKEEKTTNNRMELTAIVKAIKHAMAIDTIEEIIIYSDSAYCLNPINSGWIYSWNSNNWKTKEGKDVKNVELWKELYSLINNKRKKFKFVKVKGHSGNKYNEEVDMLAKKAADLNYASK